MNSDNPAAFGKPDAGNASKKDDIALAMVPTDDKISVTRNPHRYSMLGDHTKSKNKPGCCRSVCGGKMRHE